MSTKTIDEIEKELITVSREIGGIHECNCHYSYGLARIVWELGKPVQDMTIAELILLHKQYGITFNRIAKMAENPDHEEQTA